MLTPQMFDRSHFARRWSWSSLVLVLVAATALFTVLDLRGRDHRAPSVVVVLPAPVAAPVAALTVAPSLPVDTTVFNISRVWLDSVLADPIPFARSARLVPSLRDGSPNGLKLYAIKPGSLWEVLGFHNGDTLCRINGFEFLSAGKALENYATLREAPYYVVELERGGQPRLHTYFVR